jgi:hypothetical protein
MGQAVSIFEPASLGGLSAQTWLLLWAQYAKPNLESLIQSKQRFILGGIDREIFF